MEYPSHLRNRRHPNDQSVSTYRGHRVLRTLIRCYFSPSYRYISWLKSSFYYLLVFANWSHDWFLQHWAEVHIYWISWCKHLYLWFGKFQPLFHVKKLVKIFINIFYKSYQVTGAQVARLNYHRQIVRDCSWHPFNPMLGSSSWDGVIANWELVDPSAGETE